MSVVLTDSAIRIKDSGLIIKEFTHYNAIFEYVRTILRINRQDVAGYIENNFDLVYNTVVEGFVDQNGLFYDRIKAFNFIPKKALYKARREQRNWADSEDLWADAKH